MEIAHYKRGNDKYKQNWQILSKANENIFRNYENLKKSMVSGNEIMNRLENRKSEYWRALEVSKNKVKMYDWF